MRRVKTRFLRDDSGRTGWRSGRKRLPMWARAHEMADEQFDSPELLATGIYQNPERHCMHVQMQGCEQREFLVRPRFR